MNRLAVTVLAVLAVTLAAAVSAEKPVGKHGKHGKHPFAHCLKPELIQEMKNAANATFAECHSATGAPAGLNFTTADKATKEKLRKNKLCLVECVLKKNGVVVDGTFKVDDFVKKNVKDELQATFLSTFQSCLTTSGVTTTYTPTTADDGCKGIEKQAQCLKKAEKTCKGNDAGSSTPSSADEDED